MINSHYFWRLALEKAQEVEPEAPLRVAASIYANLMEDPFQDWVLERGRTRIKDFANWVRYASSPLTIYGYQERIFDSIQDNEVTVINGYRGMGLTLCMNIAALFYAGTEDGMRIHVISQVLHSNHQTRDFFNFNMLNVKVPVDLSTDSPRFSNNKFILRNGSTITVSRDLSGVNPNSIDMLLIDNASWIDRRFPMTPIYNCIEQVRKVVIGGTPHLTEGFFYSMWVNYRGSRQLSRVMVSFRDCQDFNDEWEETYRPIYNDAFDVMFNNTFMDVDGSF